MLLVPATNLLLLAAKQEPYKKDYLLTTYLGRLSKGDTVERTIKAEIRPKEQSEKAESCLENLWNKIQSKGP